MITAFSLEYLRRPTSRIGIVSRIERILTVRVLPTGNYTVSSVTYRGSDTFALFFVISCRFIRCERRLRIWKTALIKSKRIFNYGSWLSIQRWGDIITSSKNRRFFIKIQVSLTEKLQTGMCEIIFRSCGGAAEHRCPPEEMFNETLCASFTLENDARLRFVIWYRIVD